MKYLKICGNAQSHSNKMKQCTSLLVPVHPNKWLRKQHRLGILGSSLLARAGQPTLRLSTVASLSVDGGHIVSALEYRWMI